MPVFMHVLLWAALVPILAVAAILLIAYRQERKDEREIEQDPAVGPVTVPLASWQPPGNGK